MGVLYYIMHTCTPQRKNNAKIDIVDALSLDTKLLKEVSHEDSIAV